MTQTIVDTGPLVAYLQRRDEHYTWAREVFERLEAPFITSEPVLTEACFLIARCRGNPDDLLELIERGLIMLRFDLHEELSRVRALMKRYRRLPMSLADACLVRMTELVQDSRIVTLDSHFRVYQRYDRRPISVLMADE